MIRRSPSATARNVGLAGPQLLHAHHLPGCAVRRLREASPPHGQKRWQGANRRGKGAGRPTLMALHDAHLLLLDGLACDEGIQRDGACLHMGQVTPRKSRSQQRHLQVVPKMHCGLPFPVLSPLD